MIAEDGLPGCITQRKDELKTPLYIYSAEQLDQACDRVFDLLPKDSKLFYSLKANPQAAVVSYLADRGICPEVASAGERQICLLAGIASEDILVGGVSKSGGYLADVCAAGCYAIVIDSLFEWQQLKAVLSGGQEPDILLRIAPGVSLGGLDMAGSSQFGLSVEQAVSVARECSATRANFRGLHFYFGSQRLTVEPVVKMLEIVMDTVRVFRAEGLDVAVVDAGLGCGVPYLEKDQSLDYDMLGEHIRAVWQDPVWHGVEIWSEAGRALVGQAGYYVSRVSGIKQLHGKTFAFLDGGINVHNPGVGLGRFFRSNPRFMFVTQADSGAGTRMNFVGNLCTSADLIGQDVAAPELVAGDLVIIPNSGAYTQTTGMWGFNSQQPFSEMFLHLDGVLETLQPQYELWLQANRSGL